MGLRNPSKNGKLLRPIRVYAETSVFGGCFDDEFSEVSNKFFEQVRDGKFILIVSMTTVREIQRAPDQVRQLLEGLPDHRIEMVELNDEIKRLRDAYISADVVGPSSRADAEHIAAASMAGADVIVSWNFKHIVNFAKIRGYHAVNIFRGYQPIPIYSPREVIEP